MQRITQLWKSGIRGKLLVGCGGLLVLAFIFALTITIWAYLGIPVALILALAFYKSSTFRNGAYSRLPWLRRIPGFGAGNPQRMAIATLVYIVPVSLVLLAAMVGGQQKPPSPAAVPAPTQTVSISPTAAPTIARAEVTATPKPTEVPVATSTPKPMDTPKPTDTPRPTVTVAPPTKTPIPVSPTSTPQPPTATASLGKASVKITNIFYNGVKGQNEPDEFAEITNLGAVPVNLKGWRLNAGAPGQDFIFPEFNLQPGQSCCVYTNENHPESCGFSFGNRTALWNNGGDCGYLYDATGALVDKRCY